MDDFEKAEREGNKFPLTNRDSSHGHYAVELVGKNKEVWLNWRSRFVARVKNKIRGFFARKGPRGKSVEEEANEALGNAVNSLQALVARASLKNEKLNVEVEKIRADIEKTRSETRMIDAKTKESDAQARLLNSQSKKMELEIEVQRIQTSITYIEGLVAKGVFYAREDANGFYILVRKLPTKEDPSENK